MSAEAVSINDTVRFGITIFDPSGHYLSNTDETPRWFTYVNSTDTIVQQGNFSQRTGLVGTYYSSFVASLSNGYASGDYVEVHASGKVNNIVGRVIVKDFVVNDVYDANLKQIDSVGINSSAYIENRVWNANKNSFTTNETFGSGLGKLCNDLYYAAIKHVKDSTVPRDEYAVQWFRNNTMVGSGQVTHPAISVYKTDATNGNLLINQRLHYTHVNDGTLRYNEATTLAVSGEPYLVVTSGTIDGLTRTWAKPIGLDYL
jgi:hypothetical protein